MDNNNSIGNMLEITMQRIREMVDANTIVGTAISTPDGVTIIPVSRVSFGFGAGGGELPEKEGGIKVFGGGNGAGIDITPVAFLVIKDGNTRLLNIAPPPTSSVDRVIELMPELIDKAEELVNKFKQKDDFTSLRG